MAQKQNLTLEALAAVINECDNDRCKALALFIIVSLRGPVKYRSMHSKAIERAVVPVNNPKFLQLMDRLSPWVGRTTGYLSKKCETKRNRARCKAFYVKDLSCVRNIEDLTRLFPRLLGPTSTPVRAVLASLGRMYNSDSLLGRAFDIYSLFGADFDSFSVQKVLDDCKDNEKRQELLAEIDYFCREMQGKPSVSIDGGGRMHTALTRLPKALRKCLNVEVVRPDGTVEMEPAVEVDAKSAFYANSAVIFADGKERERMLKMIDDGRFYEHFAEHLGISVKQAKKQMLTSLFMYKCKTKAWKLFRKMFPKTAKNIEQVRDRGRVIFDGFVKTKMSNGKTRTYRKITRLGQRILSRVLTRAESEVFNRAICTLYAEAGIVVGRVHDCLIGPESEVETIKYHLEQSYKWYHGRALPVSVEHYRDFQDQYQGYQSEPALAFA